MSAVTCGDVHGSRHARDKDKPGTDTKVHRFILADVAETAAHHSHGWKVRAACSKNPSRLERRGDVTNVGNAPDVSVHALCGARALTSASILWQRGRSGGARLPVPDDIVAGQRAVPMKPFGDAFLSNVLEMMLDAVCVVDAQHRFVFVSAACERIFGYAPDEMVGRDMLDFVHPDDRLRTLQAVDEIVAVAPKPHFENRYVHKDGHVVHIMWSARWSETEQVRVAVARDVTDQRRAESLQAAMYAVSDAAHNASTPATLFAKSHAILQGQLDVSRYLVVAYDDGQPVVAYPPGAADPAVARLAGDVMRTELLVREAAEAGDAEWLAVPCLGAGGVVAALLVRALPGHPFNATNLALLQCVATHHAMAIERHRAAELLVHAARHDLLTGLPNRLLLGERLQTALVRARQDGAHLSVLYIDLDQFKEVNDRRGHAVGDLLLQEASLRIKACVRDSDTVARIGGDEFVVLLGHLRVTDCALIVAEKIRVALSRAFELGEPISISPSIGIASYPEHGETETQLLHHADAAMYQAKRSGGNRFWTGAKLSNDDDDDDDTA